VAGNCKGITLCFFVHQIDLPIITTAFKGEFELCKLTKINEDYIDSLPVQMFKDVRFKDYFPPPPYSHLLTRAQELQRSPFKSLIAAISTIEESTVGLYQALFEPVPPEHNWHRNVEFLLDIEYTIKLQQGYHLPQRYSQQSPSGDLRQMAWEVVSKAHNDKPFYFMACRAAILGGGAKGAFYLDCISTFVSLFQHGGRPMNYLTDQDYKDQLSSKEIRDMFLLGLTYRPGFLVNSQEIIGLVHVPALDVFESHQIATHRLEKFTVQNPDLFNGTWIGTCFDADVKQEVCIPAMLRKTHLHLIGRSGKGKSTVLEHIIMHDIEQGHGVAVLDPHGDLVENIVRLIPRKHVERTIYLNPGDPDWVPLWNPLSKIPGQDTGRTANNIVTAIKSFVEGGGWGDRLETILRNMIFALLHLPDSTFLDLAYLLRNDSQDNNELIREIREVIGNETSRLFWRHDYKGYKKTDLGPPINKLSKLLLSDTVSLMLSQPENRIIFRQIMDERMILLVNLSDLDTNVKRVLGCFILSLLHLNALSRSVTDIENRKQFHIHCDEAHQFVTDTLESVIAETRKFSVSLSLAHHYLSQFSKDNTDALSTVGTSIIFNVNKRDAAYLAKDLQDKVKAEDLVALKSYEAFARMDTDIVKIKTPDPLVISKNNFRDQIIEQSRKKYCKPASEIRKYIQFRANQAGRGTVPLECIPNYTNCVDSQEFVYDEFK
jgi:energy-coupling factor transporter ATP-binding protein EcfA2